jgi:hypothetical protein
MPTRIKVLNYYSMKMKNPIKLFYSKLEIIGRYILTLPHWSL